jgi:hypothetical protein
MNVLDMVPSLARDRPHTYEPIASRAPPKGLASPARGAPHTDEFGSLEPEPSQTRTCVGTLRHEPSSLARKPGSWVRIPLRAWMFDVCVFLCLCCPVFR